MTPKYKPLNYDKDVSIDYAVAYGQAAKALDAAAVVALASSDAEALSTVAALWMRIGDALLGADDDEEVDVTSKEGVAVTTLGFNNNHKESEDE